MTTEADIKRALVKSIELQGGTAFRIEDRYSIGRPDLVMLPLNLPVFFLEAKLIHGAKLICTDLQGERLKDLHRPPHSFAKIIGFKDRKLYLGNREQPIAGCLFIHAPSRLLSAEWEITDLLRRAVDAAN